MRPVILIPARLASTRLPGKPLADIAGKPMIVRVAERAAAANVGPVVIATDSDDIALAVKAAGFQAVITGAAHQSGSDRIFEALTLLDPNGDFDTIVNLQGDLPTIEPETIRAVLSPLLEPACDIATVAVPFEGGADAQDPSVVKLVGSAVAQDRLRALYFTRATAPTGQGPLFHHVGIYAYRRAALERFVALGPSALERRESLEQLRALEAGLRIDAAIVDAVPLGWIRQRSLRMHAPSICPTHAPTGSPSRESREPIPTRPAATCIPAWSPCPAIRSRKPSPR
ncbi:3-deoxy-manno-octulosonate cytidylyltransferase [Aureimonas altamirensis]|uniref:3-deoxy-manno-octulosonate cytidylyltransferase n=1 Tax=Aureimonas altamirensis TaxID=370622 RepID=UPI001E28573C|nr:3-deoxy-manno-octulosonate cytidylyltransferase [Aureimonas altamirensis]UHD47228.1 3-deoxy-manno-octulosonate cytidylyltransferase [Aureimonas altamirensis]